MRLRQISDLNKEEKLSELTLDMQTKQSTGQIMGLQDPMYVSDDEVKDLMEDIIDDIWYITNHPNFEFERKFYPSDSFKFETKNDINKFFNNNNNKVFIWYNLLSNNLTYNGKSSYMLRGKFVDNTQYIREEKINQILEE